MLRVLNSCQSELRGEQSSHLQSYRASPTEGRRWNRAHRFLWPLGGAICHFLNARCIAATRRASKVRIAEAHQGPFTAQS